jgi:hypothetical protein
MSKHVGHPVSSAPTATSFRVARDHYDRHDFTCSSCPDTPPYTYYQFEINSSILIPELSFTDPIHTIPATLINPAQTSNRPQISVLTTAQAEQWVRDFNFHQRRRYATHRSRRHGNKIKQEQQVKVETQVKLNAKTAVNRSKPIVKGEPTKVVKAEPVKKEPSPSSSLSSSRTSTFSSPTISNQEFGSSLVSDKSPTAPSLFIHRSPTAPLGALLDISPLPPSQQPPHLERPYQPSPLSPLTPEEKTILSSQPQPNLPIDLVFSPSPPTRRDISTQTTSGSDTSTQTEPYHHPQISTASIPHHSTISQLVDQEEKYHLTDLCGNAPTFKSIAEERDYWKNTTLGCMLNRIISPPPFPALLPSSAEIQDKLQLFMPKLVDKPYLGSRRTKELPENVGSFSRARLGGSVVTLPNVRGEKIQVDDPILPGARPVSFGYESGICPVGLRDLLLQEAPAGMRVIPAFERESPLDLMKIRGPGSASDHQLEYELFLRYHYVLLDRAFELRLTLKQVEEMLEITRMPASAETISGLTAQCKFTDLYLVPDLVDDLQESRIQLQRVERLIQTNVHDIVMSILPANGPIRKMIESYVPTSVKYLTKLDSAPRQPYHQDSILFNTISIIIYMTPVWCAHLPRYECSAGILSSRDCSMAKCQLFTNSEYYHTTKVRAGHMLVFFNSVIHAGDHSQGEMYGVNGKKVAQDRRFLFLQLVPPNSPIITNPKHVERQVFPFTSIRCTKPTSNPAEKWDAFAATLMFEAFRNPLMHCTAVQQEQYKNLIIGRTVSLFRGHGGINDLLDRVKAVSADEAENEKYESDLRKKVDRQREIELKEMSINEDELDKDEECDGDADFEKYEDDDDSDDDDYIPSGSGNKRKRDSKSKGSQSPKPSKSSKSPKSSKSSTSTTKTSSSSTTKRSRPSTSTSKPKKCRRKKAIHTKDLSTWTPKFSNHLYDVPDVKATGRPGPPRNSIHVHGFMGVRPEARQPIIDSIGFDAIVKIISWVTEPRLVINMNGEFFHSKLILGSGVILDIEYLDWPGYVKTLVTSRPPSVLPSFGPTLPALVDNDDSTSSDSSSEDELIVFDLPPPSPQF